MQVSAVSLLALLASSSAALAADPCADVARKVADLKEGDAFQATSLLFASARLGCEKEAQALLGRGAAIDARDREGATALAKAAQAGKTKLVAFLIDNRANVNARSVQGSTPLFYAVEADRPEAARFLIERGADPNLAGPRGRTPLSAAAYNGATDTAELLLKLGADPNAVDVDGNGAMVYAADRANAPIVALLLKAGVDANRRYGHRLTALMWAAAPDSSAGAEDVEATIKLLLDHGASVDLKDDRGKTAADIAREMGREREAKLIDGN